MSIVLVSYWILWYWICVLDFMVVWRASPLRLGGEGSHLQPTCGSAYSIKHKVHPHTQSSPISNPKQTKLKHQSSSAPYSTPSPLSSSRSPTSSPAPDSSRRSTYHDARLSTAARRYSARCYLRLCGRETTGRCPGGERGILRGA